MTDSNPLQKIGGRKKSAAPAGKTATTTTKPGESEPISRSALLEQALALIGEELKQKKGRPTNTIGNLVQLLKLDRSIREEEDRPDAIRIIWDDGRDPNEQSNKNETSREEKQNKD